MYYGQIKKRIWLTENAYAIVFHLKNSQFQIRQVQQTFKQIKQNII